MLSTAFTKACAAITVAFAIFVASVATTPVAAQEQKHGKDEKHKLGRKAVGDYLVSVIVIGEVEAGGQVNFDIKLVDAKSDPKALRMWIGDADAKGSEKAAGKKGTVTYAGQVNVPQPLPADAKLWVELETDRGTKVGSFELEKHDDHKH
jgi:hypothetical protein